MDERPRINEIDYNNMVKTSYDYYLSIVKKDETLSNIRNLYNTLCRQKRILDNYLFSNKYLERCVF